MQKTEMDSGLYVGVDLHKTQFTVSSLTANGEVLLEGVYKTEKDDYSKFCRQLHDVESTEGCFIRLAVEATGNARFFKNLMESNGFDVVVVNTNKFKVITSSTKKTDANDATTLAYYLMKDMLPESHLCDQSCDDIRRMLKARSILVSSTVKMKNLIHGLLLGYGIVTKAAQFQSKKSRQQLLHDLEDHHFSESTASTLITMFDSIDALKEKIKDIEILIAETVKDDEDVQLLQTVPGIGLITAATIASYTKDLDRFGGDFKRFSSYLGIVPGVQSSNEKTYYGPITKRGPMVLRTAFVQAALGIIRLKHYTSEWRLVKSYEQMKIDKCSGKAIIALTRKIARIVFAMLQTRKPFDSSLMYGNTC